MDTFYLAWSHYRRKNYDKCIEHCTALLEKNPYDEATWLLKMTAMTDRVYIDDLESEDVLQGTDDILDETVIAATPRPGTSLKATPRSLLTSGRPLSSSGRPQSGIVRPGTQSQGRPGTNLSRPTTSRLLTGQSARTIRLGTAAIYSYADGPFIQISRLNFGKYAGKFNVAKALFNFIYYHEGDMKSAMELAIQALRIPKKNDWWWYLQMAKCYISLNLLRNGEEMLKQSLRQCAHIETIVRLNRLYIKLDQPLTAIDVCKSGLTKFPNDATIITELARVHEMLGELEVSTSFYREVVIQDAMNVEAVACIGLHHFYTEQPELALRYYRRVLQMGINSAELYNNLALCCLYAQQFDIVLPCFQRALKFALEPVLKAEIWYNISHLALNSGNVLFARHCLELSLVNDPSHGPALNNLAVLECRAGRKSIGQAYFQMAKTFCPTLVEAQANLEFLLDVH